MELKTKIAAEDGKQYLVITREFDLPLELLFKAHVEPQIVEQWMGTKVLKLEGKKHGGWQFETTDAKGNVVFRANGVIHEFVPNQKITTHRFPLSWSFWNLKDLPTIPAKLIYTSYINLLHTATRCCSFPLPRGSIWHITVCKIL
jgi:hypothetical protein